MNLESTASLADVVVGVVFGLLAGANLVQGAWSAELPWLDLTTVAFALAIPICLRGIRRRMSMQAVASVLLLFTALALGYLDPALTVQAGAKRVNLLIGVAFVFLASVLSLSNPRRLKAFFVTIICLALPVVAGQVLLPDVLALSAGRRTPAGVNAIGSGRALGAALVIVLALMTYSRSRRRILLAPLALVLGTGLVLAGSRGPVVGALVAVLLLIWKHPSIRGSVKLALLTLLAAAGASLYRFTSTTSRLVDPTTSGREEIYARAVRVASEQPLGIGWGNFSRFAPSILSNQDQGGTLYAHNIILEFWIEAGLLAALAFTVFALTILRSAVSSAVASPQAFALAALAVDLVAGAMLSSDVIGNRMMWVVLAAVLAMTNLGCAAPSRPQQGARNGRAARRSVPLP